jgi:hypothetical protein
MLEIQNCVFVFYIDLLISNLSRIYVSVYGNDTRFAFNNMTVFA